MERLLGFDLQLLQDALITGINLFVLFMVLSFLLFNPAKELLEKRRKKIAGELSQAEQHRLEAKSLKMQYEEKTKNIQKEADQILNHAREMAKERQAVILRNAQEEADLILERARHEILLEKKKVLEEIKQEVVRVAAMMAGKAVAELLGKDLQYELIEETIEEIGKCSWQS